MEIFKSNVIFIKKKLFTKLKGRISSKNKQAIIGSVFGRDLKF